MSKIIRRWVTNNFSDPERIILALILLAGLAVVIFMGEMLAPLFASVVIAYLLEGMIGMLERRGARRLLAVMLVFSLFLLSLLVMVLGLMPLLSSQIAQLVHNRVPAIIESVQQGLIALPAKYPNFLSALQAQELMRELGSMLSNFGPTAFSVSLASISGVFTAAIYLVIMPVLVFFLLKDKTRILTWVSSYSPQDRGLVVRVWQEMDHQIGNYVRGKFLEVVIVALATYILFAVMDLQYAMLLAALVGLSVIVPYIGAIVVTIPVLLIAYFQWGYSPDFIYLLIGYTVIQVIDGNILVPWLFSEAVNLHPVAIIVAVLVFGGLWGFWGIFFAIPLAALVNAVLTAWPRTPTESTAIITKEIL